MGLFAPPPPPLPPALLPAPLWVGTAPAADVVVNNPVASGAGSARPGLQLGIVPVSTGVGGAYLAIDFSLGGRAEAAAVALSGLDIAIGGVSIGGATALLQNILLVLQPTRAEGAGVVIPGLDLAISGPIAAGGAQLYVVTDKGIVAVASAAGTAEFGSILLQIVAQAIAAASASASYVLSGDVLVDNPVAAGAGTTSAGISLLLIPTTVSVAAQAVGNILLQISAAAQAASTADASTLSTIAGVVAQAAAGAQAVYAFAIGGVAEGAAVPSVGILLDIAPEIADAIGQAIDPTVLTGAYSAYMVVLKDMMFLIRPNRARIRVQAVSDTNLDEHGATPDGVSWPDNKPKFNAKKVVD